MTICTYDMKVYLGKDGQNATQTMAAIHATVRSLSGTVEGVGLNFTWTISSPLVTYLMTCTQEI